MGTHLQGGLSLHRPGDDGISGAVRRLRRADAEQGLWPALVYADECARFQRQHAVCRRHSFCGHVRSARGANIQHHDKRALYLLQHRCAQPLCRRRAVQAVSVFRAVRRELCPRLDVGDARRARHWTLLFCDVRAQLFILGARYARRRAYRHSHHIQHRGARLCADCDVRRAVSRPAA